MAVDHMRASRDDSESGAGVQEDAAYGAYPEPDSARGGIDSEAVYSSRDFSDIEIDDGETDSAPPGAEAGSKSVARAVLFGLGAVGAGFLAATVGVGTRMASYALAELTRELRENLKRSGNKQSAETSSTTKAGVSEVRTPVGGGASKDKAAGLVNVLADPLSDRPRLGYAALIDSSDSLLGQFIRLQIDVFRDDSDTLEARQRRLQAEKLLHSYGREWASNVAGLVDAYRFSRGFVELVRMPAREFLNKAGLLFSVAPVMHLELTDAYDVAADLFAHPRMAQIRSLSLNDCRLTDADVLALASSPHVRELRWLSLARNDIGPDGVEALASSSGLSNLRFVNLFGNPFDPSEHFAHEDGRIIDTWPSEVVLKSSLSDDTVSWLYATAARADYFPDRFRLARVAPSSMPAESWTALATA